MEMKILTFDLEEWFHLLGNDLTKEEAQWENFGTRIHTNTDRILDLLEDKQQKATFFCLGWIARKYPEIIMKIDSLGHEIASHSDQHRLVYELTPAQFKADLKTSIDLLQDLTGKKVRAYRAPGFSITEHTPWVFELLVENGIEIDCSVFPTARAHGGFDNFGPASPCIIETNNGRLKEFPINLYQLFQKRVVFSGGGYFRLLPKIILEQLFNDASYIMTYFHPRDFDPDQPVIPGLSLINKFRAYYGLKGSLHKLSYLFDHQEFIDLKTANARIDWTTVRVRSLQK
jgi:polysaccharide deacetylase family protein (PEP-CTERM system associated)